MRRYGLQLAICLTAWALLGGGARGDVLFNNFGPGDTYNINISYIIGRFPGTTVTYVQGDAFRVTGGDHTLTSLTLALSWVFGPNEVDVQLRADAGGLPGNVLEAFHFSNLGPFGEPNPPVVGTSALHPLLLDGQEYWITASASDASDIGWNLNSTGGQAPHAFSQNGGPFADGDSIQGAFRVEGDSAVPEPGTLTLLSLGALGLVGYGWRRARARLLPGLLTVLGHGMRRMQHVSS